MIRTIEITQERIDIGVRADCCDCPITLSVRVHVKPNIEVWSCPTDVTFFRKDLFVGISPLPEVASQFMRDFDDERPVSPFSFPLDFPDEVLA